ncbi:hypothetical protein BC941DRAFT_466044 [Chlamydoabsidia padenii]|nr:hypothetical protein BC941DRAFT_466044 [Chlamydoabsidia padenii]
MRPRSKVNKVIDIQLHEEKFYFPGETIKGVVLVHPKSPTKTIHIIVRFAGQVTLSVKDKETIQLFSKTTTLPITTDGNNKTSHVLLDAKQHSFPFEFEVPKELPSTVEFGKRKVKVKYTLTAIHDRPLVPESLCSKVSYNVPILELVDVTKLPFTKPQEKSIDTLLPSAKYNKKCQITTSLPRFGYTRGEILLLKIVINHFEAFSRSGALEVELVRTMEIRTQKNTSTTEDILNVVKQDVKIIGPYNFSQSSTCQLMIPTSTPPTIRFKDKTLHIHYKVRIRIQLGNKTIPTVIEMPFVVGTWPRADIPIDDDDDDELIKLLGETMLSEDDDDNGSGEDKDNCTLTDLDKKETNHSIISTSSSSSITSSSSFAQRKRHSVISSSSSSSTTHLSAQNSNSLVGRTDSTQSRMSHTSIGSVSSYRSGHSLEGNSNFSRNIVTNFTPIDPHQHIYTGYPRSKTPNDMIYTPTNPLNRSTSTPDLVNAPTPQRNNRNGTSLKYQNTYPLHTNNNIRQSLYDDTARRGSTPSYQQELSSLQHHIPYKYNNNYNGSGQPSYQHNRIGLGDYRYTGLSTPLQPTPLMDDVPTKVLQPIPSTSTPVNGTINRFRPSPSSKPTQNGNHHSISSSPTISDDSDDSDEEDLFGIIERRKKLAERQMRQNQHKMYTVTEQLIS